MKDKIQLLCVICGKKFFSTPQNAPRAKVCTPFSHNCIGKREVLQNGKEKYISCTENCCRSRYKKGQSKQFMDGVLEKRKYFEDPKELSRVLDKLDEVPLEAAIAIRLIASCGLRVGESLLIRVGDCSLDEKIPYVLVPTLKRSGHPKRRVDLEPNFAIRFREYVVGLKRGANEPIFGCSIRSIQRWWEKAQKLAGAKIVRSIHSLRHTHMTRLAEKGYDPKYTQQRAGWSSLEMYKVYAHVTDSMRKDMASKLPEV